MTVATDSSLEGAAPVPSARRGLHETINALAHAIGQALPPGDVAELRRLGPGDAPTAAFWKVSAAWLQPDLTRLSGCADLDEAERRWANVLAGMAHTDGLHVPGRRLGGALAEAGYSEGRFVRLLRATGRRLLDEVRTTARFLAAKGQHLDWADLADLQMSDGTDHFEPVRRRIARDYYANLGREAQHERK